MAEMEPVQTQLEHAEQMRAFARDELETPGWQLYRGPFGSSGLIVWTRPESGEIARLLSRVCELADQLIMHGAVGFG